MPWGWITVIVIFFVQLAYLANRSPLYCRTNQLRKRLGAYAKCNGLSCKDGLIEVGGLSEGQHKILLGILKKVEAKNGSLFQAWTFAAAATSALIGSTENYELRCLAAAFLIVMVPFIFASLRGMKQVDQLETQALMKRWDALELAKEMQDSLCSDLLIKEACFDFSYRGAFLMLGVGLSGYSVAILTGLIV